MSVEALRLQGNQLLKENKPQDAVAKYSEAIAIDRQAPLLTNRALAYIKMHYYNEAIADCREAIRIDPSFARGYTRLAGALLNIADSDAALAALGHVNTQDAQQLRQSAAHIKSLSNQADSLFLSLSETLSRALIQPLQVFPSQESVEQFKQKSEQFVSVCDTAAQFAPSAVTVACFQARAYVIRQVVIDTEVATVRGREQEVTDQAMLKRALNIIQQAARIADHQPESSSALCTETLSLIHFALGDFDAARNTIQQHMRRYPGASLASELFKVVRSYSTTKESATAQFQEGKYQEAADTYLKAVTDLANAQTFKFLPVAGRHAASLCFNNRAMCFKKMGDMQHALAECTVALSLAPAWTKALLRRAQFAEEVEKFDIACHDYGTLARLATDPREKRKYQMLQQQYEAKAQKAAAINPYEVLELSESEYKGKEIPEVVLKKAYRKACAKWHPDKWMSASQEEKDHADQMIKDINEANDILKDPKKKQIYDMGGGMGMGGMGMGDGMFGFGGPGTFVFTSNGGDFGSMGGMGGMSDILGQMLGSFMGAQFGDPSMGGFSAQYDEGHRGRRGDQANGHFQGRGQRMGGFPGFAFM